jgi:hypothetical protein
LNRSNNVDEIRRKITEDGLTSVSKFPHFEKIIKLAPVLAIDRAALALNGDPVSAEATLPQEMWDHVSIDEYVEYRYIYRRSSYT